MGALHAGHLALIAEAKQRRTRSSRRSSSIRRNSATGEDFGRYPRREEEDAPMLEEAGCDLLWMPSVEDIYPDGFATTVSVARRVRALGRRGAAGPFRRRRDCRRQAADGRAARCRTVRREGFPAARRDPPDGRRPRTRRSRSSACRRCARRTASRSRRATPISRPTSGEQAIALPHALEAARDAILPARRSPSAARGAASLLDAGFSRIDYFALVDAATLEPLDEPRGEMRLIAAAVIGTTRLIDNLAV